MSKEIKDSGTILAVSFVLFMIVSMMFIGCAAMNSSVSQSGPMTSVMQNFTVQALKIDVDPTTIKIISDDESSSYISGSNWFAELPDGRKYKCNKMRQETTFCVKIKSTPISKPSPNPSVSTGEKISTKEVTPKSLQQSARNDNSLPSYLTVTKKTNIRAQDNAKSKIITTLKSGEIIEKLDESGAWYKIKTKKGLVGWTMKSTVKESE